MTEIFVTIGAFAVGAATVTAVYLSAHKEDPSIDQALRSISKIGA